MSAPTLASEDVARLGGCLAAAGVAVFPTDTVYGLGCDPRSEAAAERLYRLKGRRSDRPAAVMFFSLQRALDTLPELAARERAALQALLPGPVTLLLPNRERRFVVACGPDPDTLGLRVPGLSSALAALGELEGPLLQSSANRSGEPDARRLDDVPRALRDGVDLVLDAGELPGVASTVVNLRDYERAGRWRVLRAGAQPIAAVRQALGDQSAGG